MKSYLRFLSRNKLYTAIEVVGLSLALAFVIVLSSYIVEDLSVNQGLKNTDDIYLCHDGRNVYSLKTMGTDVIPEITEECAIARGVAKKTLFSGITHASHGDRSADVTTLAASANFFEFFTFVLKEGDPQEVLKEKHSVIISEEMASLLFPDGDALGKDINLFEENSYKAAFPDFTDLDVNLKVSGIFKPFPKTVFKEADIIITLDLYREVQHTIHNGMLEMGEICFARISEGADIEGIARQITDINRKYTKEAYGYDSDVECVLTPFDDIKKMSEKEIGNLTQVFCNIRNGRLFGIYLAMCIFLAITALMDYVVLTIAFSRFRLKEIATRQLLGTDRRGIVGRCFAEALVLLVVSCIFAILIAVAFKTPIGSILGTEIHPLSHLDEYLILAGIVLLMVALASAVPSIILSSYSAINVIKGEARYKDKILFGKIFIALAGLLSIGALAICFGITRQTRHLTGQPLGYETEGVIFVTFTERGMHRYYDELKAEPYVSRVGKFAGYPTFPSATNINWSNGESDELRFIEGDRDYFEILGIEFIEEFSAPTGFENIYMCKSTYEATAGLRNGNQFDSWMGTYPICGIVSDLKVGQLTEETTGKFTGISILNDFSMTGGEQICVKTIDNINEVCRKLREFYHSKGYNDYTINIKRFDTLIEKEIEEENNILKLITGFSIICILMTIMTIVGLSSYHSKSTEKDNAVRNVFGCPKKDLIVKLVLDFTLPVVISAIVAIPVAYTIIGRWLEGYVIRTDNSPLIYAGAFAVVIVVVLAAILLQAFRLMRTNPAETLKKE